MPGRHDEPVVKQRARIAIGVEVCLVRDVVAVSLEEPDELDLGSQRRLVSAVRRVLATRVGAIERHAEARRLIRLRIEPAAPPVVVRLPCVDRDLHEDLVVTIARCAHDEEGRRAAT